MTTDPPIAASLRDVHRAAVEDVNRWRGHCVDHFARIESCMAKVAAAMLAHPDGTALKRPTLFGGHVSTLKNAVAADGPFATVGSKLRAALEQCEPAFAARNFLIHGTGRVLIDEPGAWVWLYQYQPTGLNKPSEDGSLTKDQARDLEKKVRASRDRLKSRLDHLADHLASNRTV